MRTASMRTQMLSEFTQLAVTDRETRLLLFTDDSLHRPTRANGEKAEVGNGGPRNCH